MTPRFYAPPVNRRGRPVLHPTHREWRRRGWRIAGCVLAGIALAAIFTTTWRASIAIACPAGAARSDPARKTDLRCDFPSVRDAVGAERDDTAVVPLPRYDPDAAPAAPPQLHARRAPQTAAG
jgi:hypothetical protein